MLKFWGLQGRKKNRMMETYMEGQWNHRGDNEMDNDMEAGIQRSCTGMSILVVKAQHTFCGLLGMHVLLEKL